MSEIGVFFKTVIELEKEEKAETLSNLWMGSNLVYKDLKEVLDKIQKSGKEPTTKEINDDWKRLASFMSKQG